MNINAGSKYFVLKLSFILALTVLLQRCAVLKKQAPKKYSITILNPTSIERADELIVLSRETIEMKTGKLKEGLFVSVMDISHRPLIVQFDDINKDGKWDEAAFLYTLKPNQTAQLTMSTTAAKLNKAVVRAHVTEGPAWENDKVAFRMYTRNAKGVFGKMESNMIMDSVKVNPENSNQKLTDRGLDLIAVGNSLGAGSLAMNVKKDNGKDTLVRLGGSNVQETRFEKVADGPIRAIFRMHYKNWTVINGVTPVNVTEEISIWGGKYYYESKVTVSNAPPGAQLVTGLPNIKSKKANEISSNNCKILLTYDTQTENNDKLGLAVVVNDVDFAAFSKAPNAGSDVLNSYTLVMPITKQPVTFRFFAGWELSDLLFINEESFKTYVEYEAMKFSKPVTVTL